MMTNEEVLEILSRPFSMKNVPDEIIEAHKIAIEALKEQVPFDAELYEAGLLDYWIPVSERLPEKEGQYLVTVQGFKAKFIEVANFSLDLSNVSCLFRHEKGRSGWWSCDDSGWDVFIYSGVIAWMPSPPCYEPQESEDKK